MTTKEIETIEKTIKSLNSTLKNLDNEFPSDTPRPRPSSHVISCPVQAPCPAQAPCPVQAPCPDQAPCPVQAPCPPQKSCPANTDPRWVQKHTDSGWSLTCTQNGQTHEFPKYPFSKETACSRTLSSTITNYLNANSTTCSSLSTASTATWEEKCNLSFDGLPSAYGKKCEQYMTSNHNCDNRNNMWCPTYGYDIDSHTQRCVLRQPPPGGCPANTVWDGHSHTRA